MCGCVVCKFPVVVIDKIYLIYRDVLYIYLKRNKILQCKTIISVSKRNCWVVISVKCNMHVDVHAWDMS
jgi:hypothetical protein